MAVSKTSDFPETVVQQRNQPKEPNICGTSQLGNSVSKLMTAKTGETLPQPRCAQEDSVYTLSC